MTATQARVRAAVPLVWAAAMVVSRFVNPWIPIAIAALAMCAAILATDRDLMRRLFGPSARALLLGFVGAAIMVAATYLLYPFVATTVPEIAKRTRDLYTQFLSGRPTIAVLLFIIPIVATEEILWRGAFQEWLAERMPARPAVTVVLSATVYALAHAPFGSALLVGVAFLCGLCWSSLRSVSRSLLPSLIAHLAWDLMLVLIPLHR